MTMASAESITTEDPDFTCAICREEYTVPRYLPTCGHTFCEKCLSNIITSVKERDESGSQFECPVCRKPQIAPENIDTDAAWVQTFTLNTVIIKMMESRQPGAERSAGVENPKMCDPCKGRGETKAGTKYCFNGHQVFCETCMEYHQSFNCTDGHNHIDLDKFPSDFGQNNFLKNFMKCPTHPERDLELYCEEDGEIMCLLCAKNAGMSFDDLDVLSDLDVGEEIQEETLELKKTLEAAIEHLKLLQKLRSDNRRSLEMKMKEIKARVEQMKDQVVQLMDKMVQHVSEVTKQILIETENKLDDDSARVTDIIKKLKQDTLTLDTIAEHGSERLKFVTTKLLRKNLGEAERNIEREDTSVKQYDASLNTAEDLTKLVEITDMTQLVDIKLRETTSGHKYHQTTTNYMKDKKLVKTGECNVRPRDTGCSPTYRGITVNSHHLYVIIILADNCSDGNRCGFLCVYNPIFKSMLKLKLNQPFCAVATGTSRFAVSIPDQNSICSIVTVDKELKIEKAFHTVSKPKSLVVLKNGLIAVSWAYPPAFGIVDISGAELVQQTYLTEDTSGRQFRSFEYLAVDEKRSHVIQPCTNDKAVYCFDLTGKPVFKYTYDGLIGPRGVALDKIGNIYVCEYNNNCIHKLSPVGQKISIFSEGIPNRPLAICSDKSGKHMFITQYADGYDKIHMYRLA